jgi:hypothetical protein
MKLKIMKMKHPVVLINDYEIWELEDNELLAVIDYIKKESIEGVDAIYGFDTHGVPYNQTLVFGEDAMELMKYSKYIQEANHRGLTNKKELVKIEKTSKNEVP